MFTSDAPSLRTSTAKFLQLRHYPLHVMLPGVTSYHILAGLKAHRYAQINIRYKLHEGMKHIGLIKRSEQ